MTEFTFNDRQNNQNFSGQPGQEQKRVYSSTLYDDPATINPDELATFPKQVKSNNSLRYYHHHVHMTSAVRNGSNITRTDNHPDKYGYM